MNDGSEFGGLKEFVEAQNAAPAAAVPATPAAAPVETKEPAAAPPAETKPQGAGEPPTGTAPAAPAPTAAQRKKWKIPGKVAGEAKEWEIGEDDLENPESEGYKKLVERHQKAEDYDRPGGALDQRAAKMGNVLSRQQMIDAGLWIVNPDGSVAKSPQLIAYDEYRAKQAEAAKTPPAPTAPAAPAGPTPRQARIDELQAAYDDPKQGINGKQMRELQELLADERFDLREAERDKRTADAKAAADAELRRTQEQHKTRSLEQKAAQDRAVEAQGEIDRVVKTLEEQYRDPMSGQIDPQDIADAKELMAASILRTGNWEATRQEIRNHAARHAARNKAIVERIPKAPTAPPPPPVHRGATAADAGTGTKEEFDPANPFKDGGLTRWAKQRVG